VLPKGASTKATVAVAPVGKWAGRACDRAAKDLLAARNGLTGRALAVLPAPTRPQTQSRSFHAAHSLDPINIQTFSICPKIREVDEEMTPALQGRVFEIHPELCFREMNGAPMMDSKKSASGYAARLAVLAPFFPGVGKLVAAHRRNGVVGKDDILDAYAALWTAQRVAQSKAKRISGHPPTDAKSLQMEMWY
jgi:predicted RNase H-like nuclease